MSADVEVTRAERRQQALAVLREHVAGSHIAEGWFEALEAVFRQGTRESVVWFGAQMEVKLRGNDHKGGWENVGAAKLFTLLLGEVEELREAVLEEHTPPRLIDEAADVANFAMMIADNARRQG